MEPSENIAPVNRSAPDRSGSASVFSGTVTEVKSENGSQTLEVRFSHGRIRMQAEGDFQAGEKVRITFPGNGSVQVDKGAAPVTPAALAAPGDPGVSYTLPQNMAALRGIRDVEERIAKWMSGLRSGGASAGASDQGALLRLALPQLLMKVMDEPGGREILRQSLLGLGGGVIPALLEALEESKGEGGLKAQMVEFVKTAMRGPGDGSGLPAKIGVGARGAEPSAGAPPETEAPPWFGRILDKRPAEGLLAPLQRLRFAGAAVPGGAAPGASSSAIPMGTPLFRYVLDLGGRTVEVLSAQSREPGELADFELEPQGGRMLARFTDPAAALPAATRSRLESESATLRQGILVAAHHLREFQGEPYFGKLVEEFGQVLAQSGRLDPATGGRTKAAPGGGPDGSPPFRPEGMASGRGEARLPDREDVDGLLRLFVAFPRDTEYPARQARAWSDALRDPKAMMALLQGLRPDKDASLLLPGTPLHLAAGSRGRPEDEAAATALAAATVKTGDSPEATTAWLKKLLPETFRSEDLFRLAKEAAAPAGKEAEAAAKFMLQAVAGALPREDQMVEGRAAQFFFYQGQEWRNLQVTWEKGGDADRRGKGGRKAPMQVRVETRARNMGQVNVGVSWEPKGARLEFRNQFHDVRGLLEENLPELEKSLALLDFRVTSWTYDLLPETGASHSPDPGWTRPASLSDGSNLDLFG